jgi:hypothetical protein
MIAIFLCPFAYSQQGITSGTIQPKAITQAIDSVGPEVVIHKLSNDDAAEPKNRWNDVLHKIQTGSPVWLDVGSKLANGAQGGTIEDLWYSLSIALTHNAAGVLSRFGSTYWIESVCRVPYYEGSKESVSGYRISASAALRKITDPKPESQKEACLKSVNKNYQRTK